MNTHFEVNNIGPIEHVEFELRGPGVFVIEGPHASGKTTLIRTAELVVNGRTDVPPSKRDGAKSGTATLAGKTLRITTSRRAEEGDLEIKGVGDLNLATLHFPKFEHPITRDKHRIATLVRLAGVQAHPAMFYGLTSGREWFDKLVDARAYQMADLVDMHGIVKRSLERAAVEKEKEAERLRAQVAAQRALIGDVDLAAPADDTKLRDAVTAAVEQRAKLVAARQAADDTLARSADARAALTACGDQTARKAELEGMLSLAVDGIRDKEADIADLERKLSVARSALQLLTATRDGVTSELKQIESAVALAGKWREQIALAEAVSRPTDDEIGRAHAAVDAAQTAVERGAIVRRAREASDKAKAIAADATAAEKYAERLRGSAADARTVLADAIAKIPDCPLSVAMDADGEPRLVISTDRSQTEPFDELSDGQRWEVVVGIAARTGNLVTLSQAAWGELSESKRDEIDAMARRLGCQILTAEVKDGVELRLVALADRKAVVA